MKKTTTLFKLTFITCLITLTTGKLFAQKADHSVTDSVTTKPKADVGELDAFFKKIQNYSDDQKSRQKVVAAPGLLKNNTTQLSTYSNANGIVAPPSANSKMSIAEREKLTLDHNILQSRIRAQQEEDINQARSDSEEAAMISKVSKPLVIRTSHP